MEECPSSCFDCADCFSTTNACDECADEPSALRSIDHSVSCCCCPADLCLNGHADSLLDSDAHNHHHHVHTTPAVSSNLVDFNDLSANFPLVNHQPSASHSNSTYLSLPFDTSKAPTHHYHTHSHDHNQQQPCHIFSCGWKECNYVGHVHSDLVAHVNSVHLNPKSFINPSPISSHESSPVATPSNNSSSCNFSQLFDTTSCHLDLVSSCSLDPPCSLPPTTSIPCTDLFSCFSHPVHCDALPSSSSSTPTPSLNLTPSLTTPVVQDIHICQWENCSLSFSDSAALMDHISSDHVGTGKSEYECKWRGCSRASSGRTFAQRQKVMRHIQAHTGNRPYTCTICGKSFSESTTLAHHIRTHTKEKPHACPHPGCGKRFAISSALTIHLRTHSGQKPFACPHPGCTARFTESSNLRKHVRTHNGERPFRCDESGCGKRFARSDQLARHKTIHDRNKLDSPVIINDRSSEPPFMLL